jgi:hypothetical protein
VATSLEAGKRLKFSNSSQFRSKLLLRLSEFVNARALSRTNRRIGSPGLAELPQIWSSGHSSVLKKLTILPALHSFLTDRWQQVEKLCQSALELGESQRRAFVEACAGGGKFRLGQVSGNEAPAFVIDERLKGRSKDRGGPIGAYARREPEYLGSVWREERRPSTRWNERC